MSLTSILGWATGGVLREVIGPLERAYDARLKAKNDRERLEAEKQIAFFEGQIRLAAEAAKNDRWWSTRELIAKCALIYIAKIIVWDTVLQLGVTRDPGPQVTGIVMLVLGFYFGSKAASDIAAKLLEGLTSRR